jgi:polyisoprenoid-binding protein YceI
MKRIFTLLITVCSLSIINGQQYEPVDDKSTIKFGIKNFGVGTGGEFKGIEGTIEFDKVNADKAVFIITVDAAKVNTDNDSRDSHLRKEEYFNVAKFPKISFKSEKITSKGSGFTMSGSLTIKGVTKSITFPFTSVPKDDGYQFDGSFQINRRDFGVGGNSMVLGDNVTLTLSVFAKKK